MHLSTSFLHIKFVCVASESLISIAKGLLTETLLSYGPYEKDTKSAYAVGTLFIFSGIIFIVQENTQNN